MTIYELGKDSIKPVQKTTFASSGIKERGDLQRLLRENIEIISEQTMVIAEEFGDWDTSKRRIDLLCIDKDANLVVIELKRTEDGGHMELQAIRYSAMVSTMTFEQAVEAHKDFLTKIGEDNNNAEQKILDFLELESPNEDNFAQDVRIVLASAEFSKELTSTVLWLNEKGIDIRCVKMEPYQDRGRVFLDIQQVIPLPEAEQFQVQVRQKKIKEQQSRGSSRDYSKYNLRIINTDHSGLNKRNLAFQIISRIIHSGVSPQALTQLIDWRSNTLFIAFDGELDEKVFSEKLMALDSGGKVKKTDRYFCRQDELFISQGKTYALSNQWGNRTLEAMYLLRDKYPALGISIEKA